MRELKETCAALGAGVAIAVIVACGGSGHRQAMAPGQAPEAGVPVSASDPRARIAALDQQINDAFARLEVGPRPPAPTAVPATDPPTPQPLAVKPSTDPTCVHGESQTCKDTCQLAESICDAATKICDIAKELAGDSWAAEKCASGTASCEKSRGKCCGCQ